VDADACIVPAGSGVITLSNGAVVVVPCILGFYGANVSSRNIRWGVVYICVALPASSDIIVCGGSCCY
jgi:hypothetical protein